MVLLLLVGLGAREAGRGRMYCVCACSILSSCGCIRSFDRIIEQCLVWIHVGIHRLFFHDVSVLSLRLLALFFRVLSMRTRPLGRRLWNVLVLRARLLGGGLFLLLKLGNLKTYTSILWPDSEAVNHKIGEGEWKRNTLNGASN